MKTCYLYSHMTTNSAWLHELIGPYIYTYVYSVYTKCQLLDGHSPSTSWKWSTLVPGSGVPLLAELLCVWGQEENFVLTLGTWIFPRPASMSYLSGILLAIGYTYGISYSGNVSRRISTLFTLWVWRVLNVHRCRKLTTLQLANKR